MISVQFGTSITGGISAGVVPETVWNNDPSTGQTYFGSSTTGKNNLVDSTGTATGINETHTAYALYGPFGATTGFANAGDNDLFSSGPLIDFGSTAGVLNLTNLNSSETYDLYIYLRNVQSGNNPAVLQAALGATSYYFETFGDRATSYVRALATTSATGTTAANYVEFAGLTGTTRLSGTISDPTYSGETISGFQLVVHPGPPVPSGLTAAAGNARVGLNWKASTGATSYDVYRGTSAGGESATPIATGVTTTSSTDTSVINGAPYYYTVASVNSSGTSGYSNEAGATPLAPTTPAPFLTSPAANGTAGSPITVTFALPGQALPGSVHLTFYNGVTHRILTLSSAEEASGTNSFSFDPANPVANSGGAIVAITGDTLIPVGTYTVTLSYQDAAGDPAATASAANVTLIPLSTQGASSVNSYSANLSGFVRSDYVSSASNIHLESGTNTTYGNPAVSANSWYWGSNGNGYGLFYDGGVTGLARDTTYHYQFVATVNGATYYGGDQTFTTTHDDPPTANNDTYYEPSTLSQPITLNVLANDTLGNPFDTITIVSFSNPTGGTVQITGNGTTLLYTPGSHYPGHDSFTYTISDGFGGASTATVSIFNPYPTYAGNFQGLVKGSVNGYLALTLGAQGTFTGSLKTPGGTYSFAGSLNDTANAVVTLSNSNLPALTLDLSLVIGSSGGFSFILNGPNGSESGSFAPKVLYTKLNPAPEAGRYTIIIPPPAQTGTSQATATATVAGGSILSFTITNGGSGYISTPTVAITKQRGRDATGKAVVSSGSVSGITVVDTGLGYTSPVTVTIAPPSGLPQGTGWATMKVTPFGSVSITGKLGDYTPFTAGSSLDENYYAYFFGNNSGPQIFPVYVNVYSEPAGYILGTMTFEDQPGVSDFDGALAWYKPAQANFQNFNTGFNLSVTMLGSVYVEPTDNPLLNLPDGGSALLSLSGGNLAGELQNNITLAPTPGSGVTIDGGASDSLSLLCTPVNGAFTGKFFSPARDRTTNLNGVFFQKQNLGLGVFTGPSQSGNVNITPQ